MAGYSVEVDDKAFLAAFPLTLEELFLEGEAWLVLVGDRVVLLAQGFAPKRTGELAASIHATAPVRTPRGVALEVVAGTREATYMEFGSAHARAQPFMRPALAAAAGGLRSIGVAARLSSSNRALLFARRARARVIVRRQQQRGALRLTPAEARVVGRTISQRLRYRGEQVRYRRPRKV